MFFAIDSSTGRDWLAGQPGVSNYVHSRPTQVKAPRVGSTFTARGAGWSQPHSYDLGNAMLALQFTTTRTFADKLACETWCAGLLTAHAWFGTVRKFEQDGTALVETYKVWKSTRDVVLELADIDQLGVSVRLTYRASVQWVTDVDYVPSYVSPTLLDGPGGNAVSAGPGTPQLSA